MQLQQVQALRRLAGPRIERLSADIRFTPFLHLLPNLRQVDLQTGDFARCAIRSFFDIGSMVVLTSLHTLSLQGGQFLLEHSNKLTQLRFLSLTDFHLHTEGGGPFCCLPGLLTRLDMTSVGDDSDMPYEGAYPVSPLRHFEGQLRSLTLGAADMEVLGDDPAKLSRLACLQQLTHLHFSLLCDELNQVMCSELNFPQLQSLHAEFESWPDGPYPCWQLGGCPELHSLTLMYSDASDSSQRAVDLQDIHGSRASSLHLALDLPEHVKACAAFDTWRLETVSIEYHDPASGDDELMRMQWPRSQSVMGILGCLACYVPMGNVTVNHERVSDRAVKPRFCTEQQSCNASL